LQRPVASILFVAFVTELLSQLLSNFFSELLSNFESDVFQVLEVYVQIQNRRVDRDGAFGVSRS
jgi:hypothetical protein